jgi:hypothetical protein
MKVESSRHSNRNFKKPFQENLFWHLLSLDLGSKRLIVLIQKFGTQKPSMEILIALNQKGFFKEYSTVYWILW